MKQRTLSYWRTSWLGDSQGRPTLEALVREALAYGVSVHGSRIERADGSVLEVRHRRTVDEQPVFVHIVSFVPGAEGSVVPIVAGNVDTGPLATVAPPNDANFLGGSMVAMVTGNHCIFCAENLNINTLRLYLQNMSRRIGRPSKDEQFEFVAVPDREVIKALEAQDVVSIGLDVTLDEYDPNGQLLESETQSIKQRLIATIRDFFERDEEIRQLRELDLSNVNAKIALTIDGRYKSGLSQVDFDKSARQIIDEVEPGFYIRTRSGTKITHNSMKISKTVDIAIANETIDHVSAWLRMEEFHAELTASGYLSNAN